LIGWVDMAKVDDRYQSNTFFFKDGRAIPTIL
jgi:hypothetical protein